MTNRMDSELSHDSVSNALATLAVERQVSVWSWKHVSQQLEDPIMETVEWVVQDTVWSRLYYAPNLDV